MYVACCAFCAPWHGRSLLRSQGPFDVAEFYERLVDAERGREFDGLVDVLDATVYPGLPIAILTGKLAADAAFAMGGQRRSSRCREQTRS